MLDEPCIRWGAHWRHLVNTIERSMRGGNADRLFLYDARSPVVDRAVNNVAYTIHAHKTAVLTFCGYNNSSNRLILLCLNWLSL